MSWVSASFSLSVLTVVIDVTSCCPFLPQWKVSPELKAEVNPSSFRLLFSGNGGNGSHHGEKLYKTLQAIEQTLTFALWLGTTAVFRGWVTRSNFSFWHHPGCCLRTVRCEVLAREGRAAVERGLTWWFSTDSDLGQRIISRGKKGWGTATAETAVKSGYISLPLTSCSSQDSQEGIYLCVLWVSYGWQVPMRSWFPFFGAGVPSKKVMSQSEWQIQSLSVMIGTYWRIYSRDEYILEIFCAIQHT